MIAERVFRLRTPRRGQERLPGAKAVAQAAPILQQIPEQRGEPASPDGPDLELFAPWTIYLAQRPLRLRRLLLQRNRLRRGGIIGPRQPI